MIKEKIKEIIKYESITVSICSMLRLELLDSLEKYRKSLGKPSSPEEYWIDMGKTLAIKEFMEKEGL